MRGNYLGNGRMHYRQNNNNTHTKYIIVKFYIIMFDKSKKPIVSKDRKQVV